MPIVSTRFCHGLGLNLPIGSDLRFDPQRVACSPQSQPVELEPFVALSDNLLRTGLRVTG